MKTCLKQPGDEISIEEINEGLHSGIEAEGAAPAGEQKGLMEKQQGVGQYAVEIEKQQARAKW